MSLIFDPTAHTYHADGERLDSNTDLLEALGFCDYSMVPEPHRSIALEVGTDVHDATKLMDLRKPWRKQYSHVEGYVEAWMNAKRELGFRPEIIETPMCDPVLKIATTPDRWGRSKHYGDITVQIKTGAIDAWVGLQLAWEEHCVSLYRGEGPRQESGLRFAVQLNADGSYIPRRFEDPAEIRQYRALITTYRLLQKHGKLKRRK